MQHDGHRGRLRERYIKAGLDAFAPHEVLELLLTYAIPRRDTKPIAYALLARFGSLHSVLQATPEELMLVDGIGETAATLLSMLLPLFRAYRQSVENETPVVKNQLQSVMYCESLFEGERYEKFYVICLDAQMRRINTVLVSSGDVAEVRVYARHIISALSQCNAMGAIVAHNHPSGSAAPSNEDIQLTNALYNLLEGVGIELYDPLIVAPTESFGFRGGGLLRGEAGELTNAAQNFERILPAVRDEIYRAGIVHKKR